MSKPKRLGFFLSPHPQTESAFERAIWADAQGYDDIWFPDGYGCADALTLAAAVAGRTQRARLATGVTPVFTRAPAILATSTLAIDAIAPGRFVLGLGSSTHSMVDGWYGGTFERPLTRVRETVELLRTLFAGAKSDFDGKTIHSHGFRLRASLRGEVPIYLGAMGPKMLELVGEVADGVLLNHFTPPERLPFALECLDRGAKRAGRRVEDIEIATRVCVRVTDDDEQALRAFTSDFTFYGSTAVYRNIISLLGYPEAAAAIEQGFAERDREKIMAAAPDELVRQLYVWGSQEACQARIKAYFEAGVDNVVIAPQTDSAPEWHATCEAFTPAAFGRA